MAITVMKNCKIYAGGNDLSGHSNQAAMSYGAAMLDKTAFGDTTKKNVAGLLSVGLSASGHWNDTIDGDLFDSVGLDGQIFTIAPETGADGELAFSFEGVKGQYQPGGSVGDLLPFTINASGAGDIIRGTIMGTGAKTSTGTGTARELGEVLATQKVYASIHVIAASGTLPTLDLIIQSDDAAGMASPINRITFDQMTGVGAQFDSLAGAITDDFWRISYTIGGTNPSFTIVVVIGIK